MPIFKQLERKKERKKAQFYSTIVVSGSYREASCVVTTLINNDIVYSVCQCITCI